MPQRLRVLNACDEVQVQLLSHTYWAAPGPLKLEFQGIQSPFYPPRTPAVTQQVLTHTGCSLDLSSSQ